MAKKKKEEKIITTKSDNILLGNIVDSEKIKNELEKYVDEKVNKVFIDELDRVNRKLLREKSKKIFVKNIIIIILLLIIGFLVYLLYSNNYFDRFFNHEDKKIEEKTSVKEEKEEKEEIKEPTLDELKKEYAHLLDNYVISEKSLYLKEYYGGELTSDLKNYLTLNSLDFYSLTKEDGYHIILNDTFKVAYEKLFTDEYSNNNFNYDGNDIRYVNMMNSYITTSPLEKSSSLIKREISDIKSDGDKIIIQTFEGLVKDKKLYNIIDNSLIEDYKEDTLLNYRDSLNKVIYTFKNNKLISLSK